MLHPCLFRQIVINVLDQNDYRPVFIFSSYDATLLEDVPVGTGLNVDSLLATDGDINENAQLSYTLETEGNVGGVFTLNGTTIVVSTAKQVDRETLSSYVLTITVSCPCSCFLLD